MGKINLARVIGGGLLAGLIINIGEYIINEPILGERWNAALKALNVPAMGGSSVSYFVGVSFAVGLVAVWLYAAIRPRFGAGVKTAILAGVAAWALAYLIPSASGVGMHVFPRRLLLYGTLWGLIEIPLATVNGAWMYKEEA